MIRGLTSIHHIGIVVKSIENSLIYFLNLGYIKKTDKIFEPSQKVNVQFLNLNNVMIELIEPAASASPIDAFLKKGGGLHHLCYSTGNIEETLADFKTNGAVVIYKPYISTSIEGDKVAFIVTKERELIELVEKRRSALW